jgi:hypothetical protein
MLSDPNFDSRKIHTKYVKRLKKRLLNGFDGGDVSVSTCMKKWTASRTLCCWMHFWRRGLCRFHSLYNSSRRLRNLLLGLGRGWLPRPSRSRRLRKPSLHGLQRSGSGMGAPPAISSTTISGLSRVKLRLRCATRHRRSLRRVMQAYLLPKQMHDIHAVRATG